MSRGYELLVAEVDRVVTSPYPTQLKQLHNIACQKCLDTDVLEWAASRPCQVDALAGCLVQALQQWPYVLEIITKVCVARVVRDALLQHEPTLLFKMVARAVDGDWQHSTASIAMLSHPLPRHITLPAATQNLFLGIVDHAAQQPSTSSIKPVYQLLKGGLGPLLGLLSHETLTQLERHFVQILRETICKEDQCLTLYCLAIMKAIVTAANQDPSFSLAGSYETQDLLASTPNSPKWKPKGMQQYFTGGKANKTLHLIVLRVLWTCRAMAEDSVEQTVELLSLANELVAFMPESTREAWCVENPIIVRKLQDKACQPELEARVQLPAFAFICALCRARDVPEGMVDKLAGILCKPASFSSAVLACGPEPAVAWFAGVLSGVQVADILISITSFAVRGESAEVIKLAETAVPVVEILKHSLKTHESVADGALAALSSASVAQDLTELRQLVQNGSASESFKFGACPTAVLSERKAIGRAVCGLFLSAALAADHSQTDVASELYPLLVETYALTVNSSSSCSHMAAQSRLKENVKDQQTPATISHFPAGANWRQGLDSHLQSRVQQDHNALSALFTNACADLERRCSEVEAPLREEQEKRSELQQQYDNLYRAYTTLEDSKSRVSMRADALEAEKEECVHDLDQTRVANEKLLARVEELQGLLRENQRQAHEQLEEMKRDFAHAKMDHATTLAKSEEHLEEIETELANARAEGCERQTANEQLESELKSARSNKNALEEELREWRVTDEEHKGVIHAAEKAREELASRCESLLADLEEMRQSHATEQQAHAEELDRREREVEEHAGMLKRQHDDAFEQRQRDHEAELIRVSSVLETAQEESRRLQAELAHVSTVLSSAQDESRRVQANSDAQIEKRDKKLSEYHKKIEQLRALCSEKDDQIAEANAMRSNLMAAMGLGKMNQGSQSAKRRSTRSAVNQSELFDDTESSVPFIDILGAAAKTQHTATQDSQLAPSPKRARSRKSGASMAPPPTQPRVSTAGRATRSSTQGRSAVRRQPLAAIDGNQSPSKDTGKTPCPGGLKSFVGCGDDTTFDGSEVFASTPGLKARDAEALPEDETELV